MKSRDNCAWAGGSLALLILAAGCAPITREAPPAAGAFATGRYRNTPGRTSDAKKLSGGAN